MCHPADIGFVDAHAKGHGRHHDQAIFLLKTDFNAATFLRLHPAVIETGGMRLGAQRLGQGFGFGAGAAINDARLPPPRPGKAQNLLTRAFLDGKGQVNVRAIKAAQKGRGARAIKQPGDNLGAGFFIGGGGEGCQWHVQNPAQFTDAQVIGAEIMAPLRHAMRLVHRNHGAVDPAQHRHGGGRGQPFGGHIQQLQPPLIQRCKHLGGFGIGVARGQRPRLNPRRFQCAHLIPHQGDQRGYHHRHPIAA